MSNYPQTYPHNPQLGKCYIPPVSALSGLSVIIITRNEEQDVEACLQSVSGFASEIILVDSGSTDQTLGIARRYTDKVFHKDFTGYAAQKQFALDKALGPWVLNIDADERVSIELQKEMMSVFQNSSQDDISGYEIPFRTYFLGTRLRFGGAGGETHIRLFKKGHASYGGQHVHEGIQVKGSLGTLRASIEHFSYRDIDDYLEKCHRYTSMIAKQKFEAGNRFHWWHHLRLPYEFVVRYLVKLGIFDGNAGLTYALLSSYYVWLKFIKLKDFEKKSVTLECLNPGSTGKVDPGQRHARMTNHEDK